MKRILLIVSLLICTILVVLECINPYTPDLRSYRPLLVVEGLITNENRSHMIKLSYSKQKNDSVIQRITDAKVILTDDEGNVSYLLNCGNGAYKTDSLAFTGSIGSAYQLHIEMPDGRKYTSALCTMLPVPNIDSVYFAEDEQLVNNQTLLKKGVSVYLKSKPLSSDKYYLRWDYEDTWKFQVPDPVRYTYLNSNQILPIPADKVKEFCWKSGLPTEIHVQEKRGGNLSRVIKEPIKFIIPDESDRLSVRYSILVKQYSISESEYNFWTSLEKMDEIAGDIFSPLPYEIISNIKNDNDPDEKVLGYFQVSAITEKRIFIDYSNIAIYGLRGYKYNCTSYLLAPDNRIINPETGRPYTWNEFYAYTIRNYPDLRFVRPLYYRIQDSLLYLVFTTEECSNCEFSGSFNKPDFWIDR
jgi:hypothetical protein